VSAIEKAKTKNESTVGGFHPNKEILSEIK
jgi:hypothetical protein